VVEAGRHRPGEIARLRDIIEPTIAVITNIGLRPLEGFRSLERVMAEKLSLLDGAPVAVIGSGPETMWPKPAAAPCDSRGPAGQKQRRRIARSLLDKDGHPASHWTPARRWTSPALGIHQLENAQDSAWRWRSGRGSITTAAVRALAGVRLPEGRGDMREIGNMIVIDDTYNANPASLRRAVQTAAWLARRHPPAAGRGGGHDVGVRGGKCKIARRSGRGSPNAAALVAAVGAFARAFESLREALGRRLITAAVRRLSDRAEI